jgi:predicted DNA-binding ribbon-helix-helix protein
MASDESKKMKKEKKDPNKQDLPKHKQLIQMLSFRVVPAYYKEIEKVANHQQVTVSKLIRSYIKEGMKRDKELTNNKDKEFRVD